MSGRRFDFLLVGGGTASAHCAAELRRRGAKGSILLVGREPEPPYDRPPLSKEYLRGDAPRDEALIHPSGWYAEQGIELAARTNVLGLDPAARTAKLQGGEEVEFGQALIATGAMVNLLRVEGAGLEGIHYLRAFGNADAIREEVAAAERVVLVGGSYIACEVAASLTATGKECAMVMLEEEPLAGGFGVEAGRWFAELLGGHGIELHRASGVESFEGDGRVAAVRTEAGERVEGDLVVVGAGVRPDTMLAKKAGVEVDDGIVCDARLETSAHGVFAAGDVCSYDSELHRRRVRVEHWDVALQQGRHAARAMLGDAAPYRELPYFFSELADWARIDHVGLGERWDEVIFRGDRDAAAWSAWYLAEGRLVAALSVGRPEDLIDARRLIEERAVVGGRVGALSDADTQLSELG